MKTHPSTFSLPGGLALIIAGLPLAVMAQNDPYANPQRPPVRQAQSSGYVPAAPVDSTQASSKMKDLFVKNPNAHGAKEDVVVEVGILVEYIQLNHRTANKFIREYAPKSADVGALRDELEKMIDEEKAELVETTWLRAKSGQRAKTESIRDDLYPTEYDPPEIPNITGSIQSATPKEGNSSDVIKKQEQKLRESLPPIDGKFPMTSANPTAFETQPVGITLEVDPVVAPDNRTVELDLAPELVERLEDVYFTRDEFKETARGIEHIMMPTFYRMRDTTALKAISGNYNLLGIHTPHDNKNDRILVLLRVDLIPIK